MRETAAFFKWSLLATVLAIVAAYFYRGPGAAAVVALLIALELSISFDNAVVNAGVLRRLNAFWQRIFLTIGILIAVFGMRVFFPIAVVALATALELPQVLDQALNDREGYAENAERSTPIIGAFGGVFLMLVALNFLIDETRRIHWVPRVDSALARAGAVPGLPTALVIAALLLTSAAAEGAAERDVLFSGLVGILAFLVVRGVAAAVARRSARYDEAAVEGGLSGRAAFASFLYLELIDASFSLDGVLGAFAITPDIVIIALGLGVGAFYVRSLTVYLVRRQALLEFRYLRSGAHWAILFLAVILLVSTRTHVPEWLTGAIGLTAIVAAFVTSLIYNRRHPEDDAPGEEPAQDELAAAA